MAVYEISVNGEQHRVEAEPETPLLWVLRDMLGLVGTKYGCGVSLCGACTIHVDGEPVRSCTYTVAATGDRAITTIEGLASGDQLHPLQQTWIDRDVPQCGYCQAGQIMSAAALLAKNPNPSDADIDAALNGNYCRCGTYGRIRQAVHDAAGAVAFFEPGRDGGVA